MNKGGHYYSHTWAKTKHIAVFCLLQDMLSYIPNLIFKVSPPPSLSLSLSLSLFNLYVKYFGKSQKKNYFKKSKKTTTKNPPQYW